MWNHCKGCCHSAILLPVILCAHEESYSSFHELYNSNFDRQFVLQTQIPYDQSLDCQNKNTNNERWFDFAVFVSLVWHLVLGLYWKINDLSPVLHFEKIPITLDTFQEVQMHKIWVIFCSIIRYFWNQLCTHF